MGTMVEISNDEGRWVVQIDGPQDAQTRITLDLNETVRAHRLQAARTTYTVAGHRIADLHRFCARLRERGIPIYWDDTPGWTMR
jgi:hypothetical protein